MGEAHNEAVGGVVDLASRSASTVISAGADGLIIVWKQFHSSVEITQGNDDAVTREVLTLEEVMRFDIAKVSPQQVAVHSIDVVHDRILAATRSCEIHEFSMSSGEPLSSAEHPRLQSHWYAELRGIACHPRRPSFATVGDDRTLRIWDSRTFAYASEPIKLENPGTAVCFSPQGDRIFVGMGPEPGKVEGEVQGFLELAGAFQIYKLAHGSQTSYTLEHTGRDTRSRITCGTFSPDESLLAVAASDQRIYMYNCISEFELLYKVSGKHHAIPRQIDFTTDSLYIRSFDDDGCLIYIRSKGKRHLGRIEPDILRYPHELRDCEWFSNSCPARWDALGLWPIEECTLDPIVTADSRSSNIIAGVRKNGELFIATKPMALCGSGPVRTYGAHVSSHGCIDFASGGRTLITADCGSRCLAQWEFTKPPSPELFLNYDDDVATESARNIAAAEAGKVYAHVPFTVKDDRYNSVKNRPWMSAIVYPSGGKPEKDEAAPSTSATLSHAFGFPADTHIFFNANFDVVYHTAALGVTYLRNEHRQIFYQGHETNDIASLAMSPCGHFVATGEDCELPRIRIWSATSCLHIHGLDTFHRCSIPVMVFSSNSEWLVSVGRHADNVWVMAVWKAGRDSSGPSWPGARLVASQTCGEQPVTFAANFLSDDAPTTSEGDGFDIVTGGKEHITFWRLRGRNLHAARYMQYIDPSGISGMGENPVTKLPSIVSGCAFGSFEVVTGCSTGAIVAWHRLRGEPIAIIDDAHQGEVWCMASSAERLVTGGDDGIVKVWTAEYTLASVHDLHSGAVRAIAFNDRYSSGDTIVTTSTGKMIELTLRGAGGVSSQTLLQRSHFMGELHAAAPHPEMPDVVATVGDDKTMRLWSLEQLRSLCLRELPAASRAVCWSNSGQFVAVGLGSGSPIDSERTLDGSFLVLEIQIDEGHMQREKEIKFDQIYHGRDSRQWVRDIRYSPTDTFLAVACDDSRIYIYNKDLQYTKVAICSQHNGPVSHIDWSVDETMLWSNSVIYEMCFSRVGSDDAVDGKGEAIVATPDDARDVQWASTTCVLGWSTLGVWPIE
eukprot:g1551.t1